MIVSFFPKASQKACSNIYRSLHNFCAMSRQLVNFQEFFVQFSHNIQRDLKRILGEALNISHSNSISEYLGCPIIQGRVKKSTFYEVILKSQKSWLHGKRDSFQELIK